MMAIISAVLAIVGGLVSIVTTGSVSAVNTLKKENAELKKENDELKARIAAADQKEKTSVDDAVARREKVIAALKAEIESLEKDQSANHDPAAVRDRLSKLLSVP